MTCQSERERERQKEKKRGKGGKRAAGKTRLVLGELLATLLATPWADVAE